jgi:hypothetical protein
MSLRNFIKKHGKRIAGTWGRVNHKKDKRAASKGIRRLKTSEIFERQDYDNKEPTNGNRNYTTINYKR